MIRRNVHFVGQAFILCHGLATACKFDGSGPAGMRIEIEATALLFQLRD
jgi:hypothetical protein